MNQYINEFLNEIGPVLCIDTGAFLQNAILARPGYSRETWPRFTLPSRAAIIAQRIRALSLLKRDIWLYGEEMGGGFNFAIREHLRLGQKVFATTKATGSISYNPENINNFGIIITEDCPDKAVPVYLSDFEPEFWHAALRHAALPLPHLTLASCQDHGKNADCPRQGRMKRWRELMNKNPDPASWIYSKAPEGLSRLKALQKMTGGPVADSATSAILGALCDSTVYNHCLREGIVIVHTGNIHTLAALVYKEKVSGLYEHHTDKREKSGLLDDLRQFQLRWLPDEDIRASGGHGVAFHQLEGSGEAFEAIYIYGPKREMLNGMGSFIAPCGDMLHAPCFGLLSGWAKSRALKLFTTQ